MLLPRRTPRNHWTTLGLSALTAPASAALTLLPPQGTPAAHAAPAPVRESRPLYSYQDAIRESVWVDTPIDGDADGRTDRAAVDIARPREPARQGRRIPVIMDASPYYAWCGRGNESQKRTYDAAGKPALFGGAPKAAPGRDTAAAPPLKGVAEPRPLQRLPSAPPRD